VNVSLHIITSLNINPYMSTLQKLLADYLKGEFIKPMISEFIVTDN